MAATLLRRKEFRPNFDLTSTLRALHQNDGGAQPVESKTGINVILCPYSFNNTNRRASYMDCVAAISKGTSLENVMPNSVTLLHEAFHVVHGTNFLGISEQYGLARYVKATSDNAPGVV
ncbi:hypothetical protein BKA67DRAFT_696396 [Truncatella angustata]|uniref:Uncharacterized protein n=1 Tax=Truncatella angustata TaxID=152316 RepID=A0A9P8UAX4_9PEZI|nr:uncharacterized protein BKA67DRAFT_696396 [Truncatella angustata]KAH6645287.1 hypothetical protein BKA67DRAFT_696396 [Truncatella angustata]